jgi:hypothetical protein
MEPNHTFARFITPIGEQSGVPVVANSKAAVIAFVPGSR